MPIYKKDECNTITNDIMTGEKTPEFKNEISRRMLKIALDFVQSKEGLNSESEIIQFLLKIFEDNGKASLKRYVDDPNEFNEILMIGYRMKLTNHIEQLSKGVGVNDTPTRSLSHKISNPYVV